MKRLFILVFLIGLCIVAVLNSQSVDLTQRTTPSISAVTPREFSGSGVPGSVTGNLPGDRYINIATSPKTEYICAAAFGTTAPACTSVASGQWQIGSSGAAGATGATGATGSGASTIQLNGSTLATGVNTVNFTQTPGSCSSGISQAVSQTSTTGNVQTNADPNCVQFISAAQSNVNLVVTTTSSSGTTFTGTMNHTLTAYTQYQVVYFTANAAVSGSPTLNIDTLGSKPIVESNGSTPATAKDLPNGTQVSLWYDGTSFRTPVVGSPGSSTILYVSQLIPALHSASGCNWFTGLRTGGSACYDDVSYLVTAAALGTATNPVKIIFDVSVGIGSTFFLPAVPYVTLEGITSQSTGIFVLSGSNSTAICNQYPGFHTNCQSDTAGLTIQSTAGYLLVQHLGINGNRGTYPTGNSTVTDARCQFFCLGISVANLSLFETNDVYIYDSPTYATLSSNVVSETHRADRIVSPSLGTNTDGIHKDGPFGNFAISDSYFSVGDDPIALNLPEGYGGNGGSGTINGITLNTTVSCGRFYANNGSGTKVLSPVTVSNVTGTIRTNNGISPVCFRVGNSGGPAVADEIQGIIRSNIHIQAVNSSYFEDIANNIGQFPCSNCTWRTVGSDFTQYWTHFSAGATVSNEVLTNATIYRDTFDNAVAYFGLISSGTSIKRYECGQCSAVNEQGQSQAAIAYALDVQSGGSIGTLIPGFDPTLITSILNGNEWSRITNTLGVQTDCGTTSTCGTANVTYVGGYGKSVLFQAPLVSGTPSTVTISGFPVPFASTTSFHCTVNDSIPANNLIGPTIPNPSTTSATLTGVNSVTDIVTGRCDGN